jgi:GrpB-like predicted nucleotidyltransferase (UPF0157 family)
VADQAVQIVEYDPRWVERFGAEQGAVTEVLDSWLAGPVEHVGSTAVPGLAAKPIVDMLAPVLSIRTAREAVPALESAGWLFWADDPGRAYRLWFLRPDPAARTHHLHVMAHDNEHTVAMLALRDALRSDAALRAEYAELKVRLAAEHRGNRDAYTNAKADFVEIVLRKLGVEPPPRETLRA